MKQGRRYRQQRGAFSSGGKIKPRNRADGTRFVGYLPHLRRPALLRGMLKRYATSLLSESSTHFRQLPGRAELLVLVRDELGVLVLEDLARRAEVEFLRLVAEEFAVH